MAEIKYDIEIDLNNENSSQTKILKMVGTGKKVLEIGCATGYMTKVLKEEFGCRVTCVEINPSAAEKAKVYCDEMIVGDIEALNLGELLKPEEFDVILLADVLEHLKDPWGTLRKLHPFLKTDGYILASIPNVAHAGLILELLEGKFRYRPLGLLDDTHLRFFTGETIQGLFEESGYTVSVWDRVILGPDATEFEVDIGRYPEQVIDYLYATNPEAETYQFIVKAQKANRGVSAVDSRKIASAAGEPPRPAKSKYRELKELLDQRDRELQDALLQLQAIQSSLPFKLLARYRRWRERFLPEGTRRYHLYTLLVKAAHITLDEGPFNMLRRAWRYLRRYGLKNAAAPADYNRLYQIWIEKNEPKPQDFPRLQSEAESLPYKPLISIVMPVCNTDEVWLRAAIESVRRQIYPHWELCIADDGSTRPHIRKVLDEYQQRDSRIKVTYLTENQGISGASNAALALATGEFVGLLDHDDELAPWALLEVARLLNQNPDLDFIYSDEDKLEPDGRRSEPFFKPEFSPDLLMSMNYITHFSVFRRSLLSKTAGFRQGFEGSQDYDLILRVTEKTPKIAHIPKILYHWRKIPGSAAGSINAKGYAYRAAVEALAEALERRGVSGRVTMLVPGRYRVQYQVEGQPLVSIIIPTKDKVELLRRCVESIRQKTTYPNYEIIVVDNGSEEAATTRYLQGVANYSNCRVVSFDQPFNYARLNNFAVSQAAGEFLLFLNNDTEVLTPDWLEEMLGHAQRKEVGAVGVKLLFPNGKIQHGGVIVGLGGVAGHAFYGLPASDPGYMGLATVTRNCAAVTAASLMMRRAVFEEVGGFDEELDVAYNDVDLCLKIIQRGYYIVWTPHAVLYHHESASRGQHQPERNIRYFCAKWRDFLERGDPFYNPNLALDRSDFMVKV
ncbi:MAG: glycosyltransferase [Bacillota bacterium]